MVKIAVGGAITAALAFAWHCRIPEKKPNTLIVKGQSSVMLGM